MVCSNIIDPGTSKVGAVNYSIDEQHITESPVLCAYPRITMSQMKLARSKYIRILENGPLIQFEQRHLHRLLCTVSGAMRMIDQPLP